MRRLLILFALFVAGNLALLGTVRGRPYALLWLYRDTTGAAFDAAPGPEFRAEVDGRTVDYSIFIRSHVDIPATTGGDHGLDDVRAAIRWVRFVLRVGDDFHPETFWLRDLLDAATGGRRSFMCDSYSRALAAVCMRMGYASRVLLIEHHISSEIYLPEIGQWVFADALYDFVAEDPEGRPLSARQVFQRRHRQLPVVWQRVEGSKGDDDELTPANLSRLEDMIRAGNFVACDGGLGFGRLSQRQRAIGLVRGRIHAIQLALLGQPRLDRVERSGRALLLPWNLAMLGVMGFQLVRRGRRPRVA